MLKVCSPLVVLLSCAQTVVAAPELKGSPQELRAFLVDPPNEVRITGFADEVAYADIAKITLIVTTENKLLADAVALNGALRGSISSDFIAAGIAAEKINTSKFSTSPQFGWFGKKPKSYQVVNRMQIEVNSEAQMQAVTQASDSNPEVEFSDIEFEFSGDAELEQSVLEAAIEDAMTQKAYYEDRLGLSLEPVSFAAPNVMSAPRERYVAADSALEEITVMARSANADYLDEAELVMTFDEIDYSARVTVTFEIGRGGQ